MLISGSSGFVGARLAGLALDAGHDVIDIGITLPRETYHEHVLLAWERLEALIERECIGS